MNPHQPYGGRRSLRSSLALGAAAALSLTLVACSGEVSGEAQAEHPVYEAAQGEGGLTWYTSIDPDTAESVVGDFEETFPGVDVEILRLTTGQIAARYAQERSAGTSPAEVVTLGDPAFFDEGKESGWFEADPQLENRSEWPEEYAEEGVHLVSMIPIGITYNTELVETPPTTWEEVLDEKYAGGRIQYGDPKNVPSYMQLFSVLNEQDPEYLAEISELGAVPASSIVNATQTVAAGGADVLLTGTKPTTEIVKQQGAPIEYAPVSPTVGVEFSSAVATDTESPSAALLFEDFLLSERGQIALNVNTISPMGELEGTVPMPEDYRRISDEEIQDVVPEILKKLGIQ